jgi:putative N6-adenine-specific DNA methylase
MDITVTTLKGFESILAHELDALGAEDIQMGARAVTCFGDKELLYRANYELRTALRVLVPFYNFRASSTDALYKKIRDYNFLPFLKPDQSFFY